MEVGVFPTIVDSLSVVVMSVGVVVEKTITGYIVAMGHRS